MRYRPSLTGLPPCLAGFEDDGLFADLDLAVAEVAGAFVDVEDGAGSRGLRVDEADRAGDGAFAEQALAGAEDDGE